MKEMVELACLDLIDKHLVTNNIFLGIGYSNEKDKYLYILRKKDFETVWLLNG